MILGCGDGTLRKCSFYGSGNKNNTNNNNNNDEYDKGGPKFTGATFTTIATMYGNGSTTTTGSDDIEGELPVEGLAYSAGKKFVAAMGYDNLIRLWDSW